MKRIRLGNTDLKVSKVAMGGIPLRRLDKRNAVKVIKNVINMGINFIDTANGYWDSEEKIGEAIKTFSRQDLVLSSKSGARDKKTFLLHVDLSLKRLDTDYIDIYHLHGINNKEDFEKVINTGGSYEGLEEAVLNGKIRYLAFSSHNPEIAEKMMNTERFHVIQFPLNFIETKAEERLIPLANKLKIGFIAMKPMGGGMLNDANLSFRYLSQFEEIIPDPGIEKTVEMEEIIKIIKNPRPLTKIEMQKIKEIKKELGNRFCRRCGYCQPCPEGIPISSVLMTQSIIKRLDHNSIISFYNNNIKKANDCKECKECVERCPYNLNIPVLLKNNIKICKKFIKEYEK